MSRGRRRPRLGRVPAGGVCQVTHAPHDWMWVHTGLNNHWDNLWITSLMKLCIDCDGYAYGKYLRAESRNKLWDKMVEVTGDESLIFMSGISLKNHNRIKIRK